MSDATATATGQMPHHGSMGLHGIWATVGNATAMVVLAVMFILGQHAFQEQAREDRTLCREQLQQVREDFRQFREEAKTAAADNRDELHAIRRALTKKTP